MKKTAPTVALAIAALFLVGCSSEAPTDTTAAQTSADAVETTAPTESIEPTEEPEKSAELTATDLDYLDAVNDRLGENDASPDDETLVDAAHEACDEFNNGTPWTEMQLIEGEPVHDMSLSPYSTSAKIAYQATQFYCPEFESATLD